MIPGHKAAFREERAPRVGLITLLFVGVTESTAERNHGFVRGQTCDYDRDGRFQHIVNRVQFLDSAEVACEKPECFDDDDEDTDGEEACHGDFLAGLHF